MAEKKKTEIDLNEAVKGSFDAAQKTEKTYSSAWQKQMDGLLDKIQNRKAFSYDAAKDPLFKQMKDRAASSGRMAMQDTMGQAASMTGGYGSSYGQSVGQQVYQETLKGANDMIPELYELAYGRYADEGDRMLTEYGILADRENQDYNRFQDNRNFEYQKGRDAVADAQWRESFDYGKDRDAVADAQWRESFDYGKDRDAVADDQWRESFDYGKDRDAMADAQWRESFDYGKDRDAVADAQWRESFDYGKDRDEAEDKRYEDSLAYEKALEEAAIAASLGDYSKYKELGFDISKAGTSSSEPDVEPLSAKEWAEVSANAESIYESGGQTALAKYINGLVNRGYITGEEAADMLETYGDPVSEPITSTGAPAEQREEARKTALSGTPYLRK